MITLLVIGEAFADRKLTVELEDLVANVIKLILRNTGKAQPADLFELSLQQHHMRVLYVSGHTGLLVGDELTHKPFA